MESQDKKRKDECAKKGIKFIKVNQLLNENIITTFDGHGSPSAENKGKGDSQTFE